MKYYRNDAKSVVRSLLIGSLISLVIYILWQLAAQGNVPRENFKQVIAEGGNITALLSQMKAAINSDTTVQLLNAFSYMALASSFLGCRWDCLTTSLTSLSLRITAPDA